MAYYHYLWLTQFSTKIIIYYQTTVSLSSFSAQIKCLVKDQKLSSKKYCWFFVCSFWFCEIFCVAEKKRLSSIAHFWVKLRFNLMWLLARRGRQLPVAQSELDSALLVHWSNWSFLSCCTAATPTPSATSTPLCALSFIAQLYHRHGEKNKNKK